MIGITFFVSNSIQSNVGLAKIGSKILPNSCALDKVAKEVGLIVRFRTLSGSMLLFALIQTVAFSERSCRAVALALGITADVQISRQAVWKTLKKKAIIPFLEKIIIQTVAHTLRETPLIKLAGNTSKVLQGVGRILVGDASTICLHPSLAGAFPGATNQTETLVAQLKIQLIVDLITGKVIHFSLDSYRRSDAKAAMDFIPFLQAGDLLIRDLGFHSMVCFEAIIQRGAYFVSRLKANSKIFDLQGVEIDLLAMLNQFASRPGMMIRMSIKLTASHQVPCELIAIAVPEEVANERRRKLRAEAKRRNRNAPSKRILARQSWTLLVTNLPETIADNNKIKELYLMRWRIEMIFKAAKSHSGLLKIAKHETNANHAKALVLAWVVMMILLAGLDAFALGRLREVHCPEKAGQHFELEIHNQSLFKTFQKYTLLLGFYLELMSCHGDMQEHLRRTGYYNEIHNRTELNPGRTALSEVLTSVLELKNQSLLIA